MAGRVNTKFVVVLSSLLVVFILALVGVWYFLVRTDPAEFIVRGDKAAAAGQYGQAADYYRKAFGYRRNDVKLILSLADARSHMLVTDLRAAQGLITELIDLRRRALELDPDNEDALRGLAQVLIVIGRDLNNLDGWNQLYKTTDTILQTRPNHTLAHLYRGIAQVNRLMSFPLTDEQRDAIRTDLEAARQTYPNDIELIYHLALWHVIEANRLDRPGADQKTVELQRQTARDLTGELARREQEDPQARLHHVQILLRTGKQEEAAALLTLIERDLIANPVAVRPVMDAAQWLVSPQFNPADGPVADPKRAALSIAGVQRAKTLLTAAIARHPDDLRLRLMLGQVHEALGETAQANAIYLAASEGDIRATPVVAYQAVQLKRLALIQHADLKLRLAQRETEIAARDAGLEEVTKLVKQIRVELGETGSVLMLEGKIAIAREQWSEALVKLDAASAMFNDRQPEVLLLASNACVKLGELGAAVTRLENLLRLRSEYLPARYQLARLYLRVAQSEKAQAQVTEILRQKPGDLEARKLQATVYAQSGNNDKAIAAYEQLDPANNLDVLLALARLYVQQGQRDRALTLLDGAFRQQPTNMDVLRELVRLAPQPQNAKAYLAYARQQGGDPAQLAVMEARVAGSAGQDVVADVEMVAKVASTQLQQALSKFQLFWRLGKLEEARQAIKEAVALEADHPAVIEGQFNLALLDQNWTQAQGLIDRAAKLNADMAQGEFFRGQLALAQGQTQHAITTFRNGLQKRPVYSDGWRMLGEAQRRGGDLTGAINSFRRALEQRPDNLMAQRNLATTLDAAGRYDEALETYRQAMQVGAGNQSLREEYLAYEQRYGARERALKIRQQIAQTDPQDTVNRRGLAVLLAAGREFDQAKTVLEKLFADEGRTLPNVSAYATVLAFAGQREAGEKFLQQYLEGLGSKAASADWLALARYQVTIGQMEAAISSYHTAARLDDQQQLAALRELADILFERSEFGQAADLYAQIWKASPGESRVGLRYTEALIRADRSEEARKQLDELIKANGQDASSYMLASLLAQSERNYPAALAALNEAQKLAPDRAVLYYERANVTLQVDEDRLSEAISDLNRALELEPNLHAARHQLAKLYLMQDRGDEAVRQLQGVLERQPRDTPTRLQLLTLYLNQGDMLSAKALLSQSAELFPSDATWHRMQAEILMQEKNHRAAVRALQEAFTREPRADTLGTLALQLLASKQAAAAVSVLEQRSDLTNSDAALKAVYGRALQEQGQADAALAQFSAALGLTRDAEGLFRVAAQMITALGFERAAGELEKLDQGRHTTWVQMALARGEIQADQPQAAVSRLNRISRNIPTTESEAFRGLLATALHNSGELTAAAEVYRQMLSDNPGNVAVMNNLAYLLAADMSKPTEALPLAEKAAALRPGEPQILDTLGWVQFLAGQDDKALRTLRRSVRIKPLAANSYHLAEVLWKTGEKTSAAAMWDSARKLAEASDDQPMLEKITRRLREVANP